LRRRLHGATPVTVAGERSRHERFARNYCSALRRGHCFASPSATDVPISAGRGTSTKSRGFRLSDDRETQCARHRALTQQVCRGDLHDVRTGLEHAADQPSDESYCVTTGVARKLSAPSSTMCVHIG